MVTISHLTKKYVDEMPFVHEALSKKVLNYVAATELLMPRIEREMAKKLKISSIVMALRRYGDEMTRKHESGKIIAALSKDTEIGIKSGLCVISARKSRKLYISPAASARYRLYSPRSSATRRACFTC